MGKVQSSGNSLLIPTIHGSEGHPWLVKKSVPPWKGHSLLPLDPKQRGFPRGSNHWPRHLEPPAVKHNLMSPPAALPGMLLLRPCVQVLPGLFLLLALEPAVKCLPLHWRPTLFDCVTGPLHPTSRVKLWKGTSLVEKDEEYKKNLTRKMGS